GPCPPVRVLHAGVPALGVRAAPDDAGPDGGAGPDMALGQPVPLHRLPEHRPGGAAGRRPDGLAGGGPVTTRMFGERVERREDGSLPTGRGRFTADFEP